MKYHSFSQDDFLDVVTTFGKYCKEELLKGNDIKIDKFGVFTKKRKASIWRKDFKGKARLKPEMWIPFFRTSRKLRNFINNEEKF